MKRYILVITIFGSCFQLYAQTQPKDTTLQRTMVLEKEYNPDIDQANKIILLPEVKEPEAIRANAEFSNYEVPVNIKPEASQMNAAQYYSNPELSDKKGYVVAGVSTFIDVNADLGYQILNNSSDDLSIWASHRSSSGNVKSLQTKEKLKFKLNDNTGGLRYSHQFSKLKLFSGIKYTYSGFNYYGVNPSSVDKKLPDQTDNIFDVHAGVSSDPQNDLGYMLKLRYTYFNQDKGIITNNGPKENEFQADYDLNKVFSSDIRLGIGGYFRTNSYSKPNKVYYTSYDNYADLNLNPYFAMEGDNWNLRLGAFAHILFNHSKDFIIAPDVEINYRPVENTLLYLSFKGDVKDNSNNKIFYENRYVIPIQRVLDSYTSFDGTVGVKAAINTFFMDFYAGYKYTQDEHFYRPFDGYSNLPYNSIAPEYMCSAEYMDAGLFKIGTNLNYKYGNLLDLGLKAQFNAWDVKNDDIKNAKAWNKPGFESDFTAGVQVPSIPLRIDLAYHLETGRKNYVNGKVVNMKNINDISLTETYSFNKTISIFARLDNLLAQKYDIWYGYPAEGIRFMGGVSLKF